MRVWRIIFEPNSNDSFKMETDWTRRLIDTYPDFQSLTQIYQLWVSLAQGIAILSGSGRIFKISEKYYDASA